MCHPPFLAPKTVAKQSKDLRRQSINQSINQPNSFGDANLTLHVFCLFLPPTTTRSGPGQRIGGNLAKARIRGASTKSGSRAFLWPLFPVTRSHWVSFFFFPETGNSPATSMGRRGNPRFTRPFSTAGMTPASTQNFDGNKGEKKRGKKKENIYVPGRASRESPSGKWKKKGGKIRGN